MNDERRMQSEFESQVEWSQEGVRALLEATMRKLGVNLARAVTEAIDRSALAERLEALADALSSEQTHVDEAPAGEQRELDTRLSIDSTAQRHLCSEPGCEQPARARGLCSKHYQRLRYAEKRAREEDQPIPLSLAEVRTERTRKPARKTAKRGGSTCSLEECENPTYAKGMCSKHFMEWVRSRKKPEEPPPSTD